MKSLLISILVFALCVIPTSAADVDGIKPREKPFADKWAVVVGIDKFGDSNWNFKYAQSDAEKFKEYLSQNAHFAPDHIKTLFGNEASKKNIEDAIFGWLKRASTADDLAVIYVRTRGTFAKATIDRNYLAASDTQPQSLSVTGIEMQSLAHKLIWTIDCARTVLIVDSDFSREVGQPILYESDDYFTSDHFPAGRCVVVLWASESNQICWESDEHNSSYFTHDLIEEMKKNGELAPIAHAEAVVGERVKTEVEQAHRRQQQPGILWILREYEQQPKDPIGCVGVGDGACITDVTIGGRPCKPRSAPE